MAGGRTRTRINTKGSSAQMVASKKNNTSSVATLTNTPASGIEEGSITGRVSEGSDETANDIANLTLMVQQLLQKVGTVARKIDTVGVGVGVDRNDGGSNGKGGG